VATLRVLGSSVEFSDDQVCQTVTAAHSLGDTNPLSIVIGADCTGACSRSVWDSVEIIGPDVIFNIPDDTVIPPNAASFVVYTWNPAGQAVTSSSCSIYDVIGTAAAEAPTNVVGMGDTESTITLTWQRGALNSCHFLGYEVKIKASGSADWSVPQGCSGPFESSLVSSCVAENLDSNTPYHFQVRTLCINVLAKSALSEETLAVATLPQAALPPSRVRAQPTGPSSIVVSWVSGALRDCEFEQTIVEAKAVGNDVWFYPNGCSPTGSINTNTCHATGLTAATAYEYRVQTHCSDPRATSERSFPDTATTY
jgi:hypothetical protein